MSSVCFWLLSAHGKQWLIHPIREEMGGRRAAVENDHFTTGLSGRRTLCIWSLIVRAGSQRSYRITAHKNWIFGWMEFGRVGLRSSGSFGQQVIGANLCICLVVLENECGSDFRLLSECWCTRLILLLWLWKKATWLLRSPVFAYLYN